jgi:2,5-diamino-6-(ribosylamino)-4(3H)-pyrimidinone 5'-phosphate reductase
VDKAKVIIHNSVSLDGSVTSFEVNMGLYYQIAGKYSADAHLIGSNTIKIGTELYGGEIPAEEESDFKKPNREATLPYWVIPDTKGAAKGLLHTIRRFEYCKDVIILISKNTEHDYINYLEDRHYDYNIVGDEFVDYNKALELLESKYGVRTILVDSGPILNGILLKKDLVDEISLLVSPLLVGNKSYNLFSRLSLEGKNIKLKLLRSEVFDKNYLLLLYKVLKN